MKVLCDTCQQGFELPTAIFVPGTGMVKLAERKGQAFVPAHAPASFKSSTVILDGKTGKVIQSICIGSLLEPSVTVP
jgi:hypothetical protein